MYLFSHIDIDLIAIGIADLILKSKGSRVRRQRRSAVAFEKARQLREFKARSPLAGLPCMVCNTGGITVAPACS
jgi:hypothetical protein